LLLNMTVPHMSDPPKMTTQEALDRIGARMAPPDPELMRRLARQGVYLPGHEPPPGLNGAITRFYDRQGFFGMLAIFLVVAPIKLAIWLCGAAWFLITLPFGLLICLVTGRRLSIVRRRPRDT
jgi:hypothetical protein